MKKILYSLSGLVMAAALLATGASAQSYPSLDKLFSDKACTVIAPEYASKSLSEIQASADYKALPSPLQKMVDKVKTGNWEESSVNIEGNAVGWDTPHAMKYRVQMVEPFSDGWATSVMMDCKPHTNLSNPTGLYSEKGTTLYIMVEGEIKAGARLLLGEQDAMLNAQNMGRYNDPSSINNLGIALKEGLNVVTTKEDAATYFHYIVDTYDLDKRQKAHRLSEYPSLKIHVEGGRINGFFNMVGDALYTPDTKADLDYTTSRAIFPDYAMIGRSFINIFPLKSRFPTGNPSYPGIKEINTSGYDPIPSMTRWEDLVSVIQTTAGYKGKTGIEQSSWADYYQYLEEDPESYADFFNNRLLNIMVEADPNFAMYSTYWFNGVGANSSADVMAKIADFNNGGLLWGPAHEYGHTVQGPINVVGSTEISNNLFSNVVNFLMTGTTSRTEYISDLRKLYHNRQPWRDGIYWTATRMYWQLWLYYHEQGHNKQFYLRLQDILRRSPLTHSSATDYLNFAKAACQAAGEDLTDFFEAYGIFVPLDHYTFDDYGTKDLNLSAAQIAACKAEIAAMGLPKNRQIIFIDDRPGSDRTSYSGYPKENAGDMGGLNDFREGTANDGRYNYSFDGSNITFNTGHGGVGFIIYDNDDRLLTFGNTRSFEVSREAAAALLGGNAKVYVVDSDGTLTAVKLRGSETSTLIKALNTLVTEANDIIARSTEADNIVGNYYYEETSTLKPLVTAASALLSQSASQPDAATLSEAYQNLNDAVTAIINNPYAVITLRTGVPYSLTNQGYPTLAMASNGTKLVTAAINPADKNQRFIFEPAGKGQYYIRLEGDDELYLQDSGRWMSAAVNLKKDPVAFVVTTLANGNSIVTWAESSQFNIHVDGSHNVVYWREGESNIHSQWLISEIDSEGRPASNKLASEVYTLKNDFAKAGTVSVSSSPIRLTEGTYDSNAKCPAGLGADSFSSWKVLYDKNFSTYFHSNWRSGSTDGLPHWISMDLREPCEEIVFSYVTRGQGNTCAPSVIKIQATNDGDKWDDITTISQGLPSSVAEEYTSPTIYFPRPYRKMRLMVTDTYNRQQIAGQYYFVMSELSAGHPSYEALPSAAYSGLPTDLLLSTYKTLQLGQQVVDGGDEQASAEMIDRVKGAHEALLAAMADPSGINDVTSDSATPAREGIYDLQGRRLREATAPGIYIINGRKVMVR